jgi:hypothetical protein
MNKAQLIKLTLAIALLSAAALLFAKFLRRDSGITENTYFYDISQKKLFSAPRESLPPMRGLDNADEDAVRAVVIAVNGNPKDKASRKIAYLEKYAPELKDHLAKVRDGKAQALPRGSRDSYRFIKRVDDLEWKPINTPEGEKILGEWNVPGPDGKYPVVCVP